jgi:hypothetical protein
VSRLPLNLFTVPGALEKWESNTTFQNQSLLMNFPKKLKKFVSNVSNLRVHRLGTELTRLDPTANQTRLHSIEKPVVEISRADQLFLENLLKQNHTIIIRLSPNDANVWKILTNSIAFSVGIAVNILFTLLSLLLIIRSLYRFSRKLGSRRLSLPIVILSLLLCCDLIRLAWLICLPFHYRGMIPIQVSYWIYLTPWPFALASILLWAVRIFRISRF